MLETLIKSTSVDKFDKILHNFKYFINDLKYYHVHFDDTYIHEYHQLHK